MSADDRFFDLGRLRSLRGALRELDPTRPPALTVIRAPSRTFPRRLALLPGSFNPPTDAHLALAAAALGSGAIDALDYLLASRTVNKERVEGAALADRLLLLDEIARVREGEGVVLVNRGLYVEQAQIARATWPDLRELWFVVGYDKLVQIFDPRYYADYRAALDRLFDLASFLVAPRAAAGQDELRALLGKAENRRYADRVVALPLAEAYRDESSTRVRAQIAREGRADDVPPIVNAFVDATGAYRAPAGGPNLDRYAWRERLLDLLDEPGAAAPSPAGFAALLDRVTASDELGARVRALAERGDLAELTQILPPEYPT
jgi:nicotinic acid mononucleotide adenylyltransferase